MELPKDSAAMLFDPRGSWNICALQIAPQVHGRFRFEFIDARRDEKNQLFAPFDIEPSHTSFCLVVGIRGPITGDPSPDGLVSIFSVEGGIATRAWEATLPPGSCPAPDSSSGFDQDVSRWHDASEALPSMCVVCWSWNGGLSTFFARHRNRLLDDSHLRLGTIVGVPENLQRDIRQWPAPVLGLRMSFVPSSRTASGGPGARM